MSSEVPTLKARMARDRRRGFERAEQLENQLKAYRMNFSRAQEIIRALTKQFADQLDQASSQDFTQSPSQRIYLDILRNHDRHPNGRRYSVETLVWAQ
jgi:hypothetical protein